MRPWTDIQTEFRDAVMAQSERLSAGAMDDDVASRFSWDRWKVVRELGILALPFPECHGGLGLDITTTLRLLEALGESSRDSGLGFSVCTSMASTGVSVERFGSEGLQLKYLPGICSGELVGAHAITESSGGSDALTMATTAVPNGDGYILKGAKIFVSNAPIADVIVVYAKTHERGGPLGITAFAVDVPSKGLSIGPPTKKMGLRTAPLSDIFLDNCCVPRSQVIGRVGGGYRVLDYVMKREILYSFVVNLGEMQRRLDRCVEYVKERKQFGQNIGSYQAVANRIVKMLIRVESGRKWIYETALRLEDGQDITIDLAITKLIVSEGNVDSGLDAIQIFGGSGYVSEMGVEVDLRNAIGGTIYSGTTEIQYNRIASALGLAR